MNIRVRYAPTLTVEQFPILLPTHKTHTDSDSHDLKPRFANFVARVTLAQSYHPAPLPTRTTPLGPLPSATIAAVRVRKIMLTVNRAPARGKFSGFLRVFTLGVNGVVGS